jgi:site-specific DNA recombinase
VTGGIVSYLRVSTGRQKNMATIETQRDALENYNRQNTPQETVEEFADDGVSSRVPFALRPASGRLLRKAEQDKVREIRVYALNRLGRDGDSADTLNTVHKLWRLGVRRIFSVTQGAFENTTDGIFMLGIHCSVGGYERNTFAARSKASSRRLAKESRQWLGGIVPFGFQQQGANREAQLVIKDDEAEIVRVIYQRFDQGQTYTEIAAYLNALGAPGVWTYRRVREVMRNPAYRGIIPWGKRKSAWNDEGRLQRKAVPRDQWIVRACPPVVEAEVWQRANARMDALARSAKAHPKRAYPLSNLIRCSGCGGAYIGSKSAQRDGSEKCYYRCHGRYRQDLLNRGVRCTNPSVRAEGLEEAIWEHVAGFLARPGRAIEQLREQVAAESQQSQDHSAEVRKLEKRRAALTEARRRVLSQYGAGLFSEEDIKAEVGRIDAEAAALERALEEKGNVIQMAARLTMELDWAGRLLGELREQLLDGTLDAEKKRKFVEALVSSIIIQPDGSAKATFRFDSDWERLRQYTRREVSEQRHARACRLRPSPGGQRGPHPESDREHYAGTCQVAADGSLLGGLVVD